jgi:hypothetical protein
VVSATIWLRKRFALPMSVRVKLRRTQCEQMSSGLPLIADITQYSRHVSKVPISDIDCTAGYVTSADRSSLWPCRDCCGKLSRLPHAELHSVLTKEDDHGNLCRAGEVH